MSCLTFEFAQAYLVAGFSVIPCLQGQKWPAAHLLPEVDGSHTWSMFQERQPILEELHAWFVTGGANAIAILGGRVSGNLEILDFDAPEILKPWEALVHAHDPDLLSYLPLVQTPSGGWHVYYRAPEIAGNQKLAVVPMPGKSRRVKTLIETRGEGGYALAPPSAGYVLKRDALIRTPTLTAEDREVLLSAARTFDKRPDRPEIETPSRRLRLARGPSLGVLPGEDFNRRGDVRTLLHRHGWRLARSDGRQEYWRRPGKRRSWSATLLDDSDRRWFYNFSANAPGLDPDEAYTPFGLYATLEHGGDFSAAAKVLKREGYGR
jgi:hypothetical protein